VVVVRVVLRDNHDSLRLPLPPLTLALAGAVAAVAPDGGAWERGDPDCDLAPADHLDIIFTTLSSSAERSSSNCDAVGREAGSNSVLRWNKALKHGGNVLPLSPYGSSTLRLLLIILLMISFVEQPESPYGCWPWVAISQKMIPRDHISDLEVNSFVASDSGAVHAHGNEELLSM